MLPIETSSPHSYLTSVYTILHRFAPIHNVADRQTTDTAIGIGCICYSIGGLIKPHQIWRHQLLPGGIYQSLKIGQKCCIWRIWVKFLQNSLSEDQEILHDHKGYSVGWSKKINLNKSCLHNSNFIFPININVCTKFYCHWTLFRGHSSYNFFSNFV